MVLMLLICHWGARASTPSFLLDAVNYAQALGTVVIVAAGNDGADAAQYTPAGIPSVITVAALDKNFKAASFSNFGSLIDTGVTRNSCSLTDVSWPF